MYTNLINYFITITCFSCIYLFHKLLIHGTENTFIIAAFGASAVLSFSKNTIKHSFLEIFLSAIIAATIGVFFSRIEITFIIKLIATLSSFILIINFLNINYPPAGAITIIPLLSNTEISKLGYLYILYPTITGLIIIYFFSKLKNKLNTLHYGK